MRKRMPLPICFYVVGLYKKFQLLEDGVQKMICTVLRTKSKPGFVYEELLSGIKVRWEHHGSKISIVDLS